MKFFDTNDNRTYVRFTYDEEVFFAQSVLDQLCHKWLSTEYFNEFAEIFYNKALTGNNITLELFNWYVSWMDRYEQNIPNFKLDGKSINSSIPSANDKDVNEYIERLKNEIISIWKEVWEFHDGISSHREFERFPAKTYEDSLPNNPENKKRFFDKQKKRENDFWAEVKRIELTLEADRSQAIILVSDYKRRGDLPDYKLEDPNPSNKKVKTNNNELCIQM